MIFSRNENKTNHGIEKGFSAQSENLHASIEYNAAYEDINAYTEGDITSDTSSSGSGDSMILTEVLDDNVDNDNLDFLESTNAAKRKGFHFYVF